MPESHEPAATAGGDDRLIRLEEAQLFAQREAEMLRAAIDDLGERFERLAKRLDELERRIAETPEDHTRAGDEPGTGPHAAEAPGPSDG